nr:hypothetical protein [uncultured Blautia sp.]DAN99333.1 MAG TPA: Lysosome-associated membrane glycoprotein 2 PROTEIN [Caudoviricetes sp.]
MLDMIIPLVIGIAIGAIGVCVWALSVIQKKRENAVVENKTDQEAVEAVNTIKRYCDCRYCCDCAIRKICQEYFDNSIGDPEDWPEVEVPHE